jgi:hypothetical protein
MELSPAEYVVLVFKGVRATARVVGRTPSSISKWRTTGNGSVPSSLQKKILDKAAEYSLDITPSDLIFGRHVDLANLSPIQKQVLKEALRKNV